MLHVDIQRPQEKKFVSNQRSNNQGYLKDYKYKIAVKDKVNSRISNT
jgi:hypothetical protein